MTPAHRRHDITDQVWDRLQPHLPGRAGRNNRLFLDAVFWNLRTGAPWRDLPPDYGDWKNTHAGENWADAGPDDPDLGPDLEWLMIDSTHIKLHPHGTGAVGGNQAVGRTKGG